MTDTLPRSRALHPETILAKCEYFVDVQLWPLHQRLDVDGWLGNFTEQEMPHALHLLNSFLYFPDHFVDQMVTRALRQLSAPLASSSASYGEVRQRWRDFLGQALISFPTGEVPNPTDSGHDFARRVRELGVQESQIVAPRELVERLSGGAKPSAVIFVDDFVGTGNQFIATWHRSYLVAGQLTSLSARYAADKFEVSYIPMFCTELGEGRISLACPEVNVAPAHLIGDRYSALNPDGVIWPDTLAPTAAEFLEKASLRAGIPDTGGTLPNDWRGFAGLALTLAFGRFVPDATLPIFYWEENGWHPLIRRH